MTEDDLQEALYLHTKNAATHKQNAVERLKAAIEGECDGLAITDEQAESILAYVGRKEQP